MTLRARVVLAALVAPLIGIAIVACVMGAEVAIGGGRSWADATSSVPGILFFLVFFGAPGAYFAEAIIGIPSYLWLKRTNRLRLGWLAACAGVAGALAFAVPWARAFDAWRFADLVESSVFGAVGGVAAGAAFWIIAFAARREQGVA